MIRVVLLLEITKNRRRSHNRNNENQKLFINRNYYTVNWMRPMRISSSSAPISIPIHKKAYSLSSAVEASLFAETEDDVLATRMFVMESI